MVTFGIIFFIQIQQYKKQALHDKDMDMNK